VQHVFFVHAVNLDRSLEAHYDLQFIHVIVGHLTADAVQSDSNRAVFFKSNGLFFRKHGIPPQK
jgi:hypothetical protein